MKNKSWIIIVIMGVALTISIAYSIAVSRQNAIKEETVTTKSIIEMTATTVTIKNTLSGNGVVEFKEKEINNENSSINQVNSENLTDENNTINVEDIPKTYQITLSIEDKDLNKAKVGQKAQISIKDNEETLNYLGEVIKINKDTNNKSTLNIEVTNPDDKIKEKMSATCTVIVEEAENVVALPIEAIQKNEENEEFVDVVQSDGNTKQVIIKTGISDDYYVEITSGLKVGDRVQIVKSSTTVVNDNSNQTSEK